MKSILQKTLAAALLVASAQAQVHVLSASWRERAANAPTNDILRWSTATPRGFLIFDSTLLSATPGPATLIEYEMVRQPGEILKTYTIDVAFRDFNADSVLGDSGGRRLYGKIYAPVSVTGVANPLMTFWGTQSAAGYPVKLTFDNTYFQFVSTDALTSPQIVNPGTVERSLVGGSAKAIPVTATTISGATAELVARLENDGYVRAAVAPVITTNPPATLVLLDGQVGNLSVTLGPNVFPTPTYQWFKNDVAISAANGGTGATLAVTGGAAATGSGTYRVEVSTSAGTAVSSNTVVSPQALTFATNLPATLSLLDGQVSTLSVVLSPTPVTAPIYQWFKNNTPISEANGGTGATLSVTGGAAVTGSGTYRVEVTTSAGTAVSSNTVVNPQALTFATNLPATTPLIAANSTTLSVALSPTPVTTPTYQWFKNNVAISAANGGTGATLLVIGNEAITGAGTYRVQVGSSAGTLVSANTNVTVAVAGTNFAFTTNLPRATTAPFGGTTNLSAVVNTAVGTPAVASFQWFRAPLDNPTAFVAINTGDGGNTVPLAVSGNNAAVNGPGVYYLVATSVGATPTVLTSVRCTVTAAP